jgi:glucose-1-phosphate thymidylyltransferase
LAQAFIIGRDFIAGDPCCLILGDNIYYGHGLVESLKSAASMTTGATVFGYWVKDPERYGVVEFDQAGRVIGLEEKPAEPKSNYAVTGLYFYDGQVTELAASLKPSARGELEITDLNKCYLEQGSLRLEKMGRGIAWLDTGTHESLIQASNFIETIELRQGLKIACPEEIAFTQNWIDIKALEQMGEALSKNGYGQYLLSLCKRKR